jgi:NTP pyrophosphatase (non-canonical NTP hydrolase)
MVCSRYLLPFSAIAFPSGSVRHWSRRRLQYILMLVVERSNRRTVLFALPTGETTVHFKEAQTLVDQWINQIGGYWDKFQILAQLMEELGEVSAALQRQEGLRPRTTRSDLEGEVGDLLFTLVAFSNVMSLDLEQCFKRTMQKYKTRDAEAWQSRSGSEEA